MPHPSPADMTRGQENRRKSGRHLAAVENTDPGMEPSNFKSVLICLMSPSET